MFEITYPSLLTLYFVASLWSIRRRKETSSATLSDQRLRLSMLSTVWVTSGRIFSAEESKLTSLIGMNIFNKGLKFIIGEYKTFREMISAARNVSRYYKLPGRETVWGPFLDKCFDNHIKNQRENLLNRSDIYGLNFQDDGATIKEVW